MSAFGDRFDRRSRWLSDKREVSRKQTPFCQWVKRKEKVERRPGRGRSELRALLAFLLSPLSALPSIFAQAKMEPWGFEPQIPPCHGGVIPFHYGPDTVAARVFYSSRHATIE